MAETPSQSIPSPPADPPNAERQSLLRMQVSARQLLLGDLFVEVYQHHEKLREDGHHELADEMDKSPSVACLVKIASDEGWKPFDRVWSAKEFRECLYHGIAAKMGGPLWFRESPRKLILEDMCMTKMPHVWNKLFDQAKESTSLFVDPRSPRYADVLQLIRSQDMTSLLGLWDPQSQSLSLRNLENKFFPKANPNQQIIRSSTSQVTGKTYKHSVKFLQNLDPHDYTDIFDSLARHSLNKTPPPTPLTWNNLGRLAREVGGLTRDLLHHVVFWLEGHDVDEIFLQDPSGSWSDLLGTGAFASRVAPHGGSLTHADQPPDAAARLFIQALFDQLQAGLDHGWKDEAAKGMASQSPDTFLHSVRFLPDSLQHACYRYRFQTPVWLSVLALVKGYVGSRFQGFMEIYNETPAETNGRLQSSLQLAVEQSTVMARLQCMQDPILSTAGALRDLTSELRIFTALYLYRHCKLFTTSAQKATSDQVSSVGNDNQDSSQQGGQEVRTILDEAAQILREAGYDPRPEMQDERLDRFRLKHFAHLLAEHNVQDAAQPNKAKHGLNCDTALTANLTSTFPESPGDNLREALAGASIHDSDIEQKDRPRPKKRRRNGDS